MQFFFQFKKCVPLGVPEVGDVPEKQARSSAFVAHGPRGSWGENLVLGGWLPPDGCGPAVSPRARPTWVTQTGPSRTGLQELKSTGAPRGACGSARMVYPAVGAFASPCEGRVERLDQVLASGCSRRFRAAPLPDRFFGATCRHLP